MTTEFQERSLQNASFRKKYYKKQYLCSLDCKYNIAILSFFYMWNLIREMDLEALVDIA